MKETRFKMFGFACAVLLSVSVHLPARAAQVFNVKSYGAVGNGVTDDSAALLAAAAAANAVPGSILLFPDGNYLLNGILSVKGIEVVGQQRATLTTLSTGGLELSGNNTKVHDMRFDTRVSSGAAGLLVIGAKGFEVRNNLFYIGFTDDISVSQSSNGKIYSNRIAMGKDAVSGVFMSNSSNISAQNNVLDGSHYNETAFYIKNSNNITVDKNRFYSLATGITSNQNSLVDYTNNEFNQPDKAGIILNNDKRAIVNDNDFDNSGVAVTVSNVATADIHSNVMQACKSAVSLLGSSTNIDIRDNKIVNADLNAISGGATDLSIIDNTIDGAIIAINLDTNGQSVRVVGNEIEDTKSAGIVIKNFTGSSDISKNTIINCGQSGANPAAVIYANSPKATEIRVVDNTYSGVTKGLKYFVWCVQKQPPAKISGNSTNTMLPNRIGS